jgi:S-adenosylmethionine hydrolase
MKSLDRNIALLTDFGNRGSHYVASMKAVISNICPKSKIIDISHTITPFSIIEASYIIKSTYKLFPEGTIFIFVIDPGVGSKRNILALKTEDNYYFVGPDNGILPNALKSEITECYLIQNENYFHKPVSHTFHGRDIMAPCGAYIANNVPLNKFGPSLDPLNLKKYPIPLEINKKNKSIVSTIQYVDSFGNITSNVSLDKKNMIKELYLRLEPEDEIELIVKNNCYRGFFKTHFADVDRGDFLFLKGSTGYLEISKNQTSIAEELGIVSGNQIELNFLKV